MNIETIREFLGWCLVINFGILGLTKILVLSFKGAMSQMHGKIFGLDEVSMLQAYVQYMANYKIAIIVFNMVPYIALRIMS